jgi:hypothetical protein
VRRSGGTFLVVDESTKMKTCAKTHNKECLLGAMVEYKLILFRTPSPKNCIGFRDTFFFRLDS